MQDILRDVGYEVETAHCAETGLDLVRQKAFDIVLLDYQMPGANGVQLYADIKKITPDVAAFLITAFAGTTGVSDAIKIGARGVFQKPIDVTHLLRELASTQ